MIERRGEEDGTNRYTFRIMGDEFTMKGKGGPEYMEQVAAYLEATINTITETNQKLNKNQVIVLAALRIADEFHQLRQEYQYLDELLKEAR